MKRTIKVITFIFIFIMTFSVIACSVDAQPRRSALIKAKPISVGYESLVDEFVLATASNKMKYGYYCPVIDSEDTTKYPVVIYIHGLFHGWTDKSFRKSGLTYWACREMQDKFIEGGAHLIMPKIPELRLSTRKPSNVFSVIEEYIFANINNIDTSQIYIMGGSAGAGITWKLIIEHPEFFSAAVVLCSTKTPSASEIKTVENIPIWEVSAVTDPLVRFKGQKTTWANICNYSSVKDKCRWSTFDDAVTLPDGSHPIFTHFLAKTIGFDFCLISDHNPLPGMSTCTAAGENVSISYNSGIIAWLQQNVNAASDGI